jgi:hypothetical protein
MLTFSVFARPWEGAADQGMYAAPATIIVITEGNSSTAVYSFGW